MEVTPDTRAQLATSGTRGGTLLTLERGISVLEAIAEQGEQATARGLSDEVEVSASTCYQILRTLHQNGYVDNLPGNRYALGTRIAFLLAHYEAFLAPSPEISAILEDAHEQIGESVYVSLRRGTKLCVSVFLEGAKAVRVGGMHLGYSDHLHARASGKAFLAYIDRDELEVFALKDQLEGVTDATIISWDALLAELDRTRQRGYAIDREEFIDGVGCISTPILGPNKVAVGAFAVCIPVAALCAQREDLVACATEAGRRASKALGYPGRYPH